MKFMCFMIVIQDTWDDEDDVELLKYIGSDSAKILEKSEIVSMNPQDITVLFADTTVVQQLLRSHGYINIVPDTYASCFNPFYHRKIQKLYGKDITIFPCFIKPVGNIKEFDAFIAEKHTDVKVLPEVYCCDVVKFVNEYRLFLTDNSLFGMTNATSYLFDEPNEAIPPEEFIRDIVTANTCGYCVVDIGMMDNGKWAVVETNPPFSLSSYDFPIDQYYQYCKNAWNYLTT